MLLNKNETLNKKDVNRIALQKITRTASSYAGVQEMCISPAQRDACVQNATVNLWM